MRARPAQALPAALLAAAAALTACSAGTPPASTAPRAAGADPGVAHVHGLGVDPADGVLYAASHHGLFRIPEQGPATRVADRYQDTMGFTIAGPGTFLGSGHPDARKDPDLPPRLGLIRSTDRAETWQSVSLLGKVDFHALQAAHGNVYGWDAGSGDVMVSADEGRTWDVRSRLAIRDLVVSPDDPDELLVTTEQGPARSRDGGRTWERVPDAPLLAVLTWAAPASLFGVAPSGRVHRSSDGGDTWTALGEVGGQPEAATADPDGGELYVAVADRGVLVSRDGGRTFTVRYAA